MLDHHHRVVEFHQVVQHLKKLLDIGKMESCGGLIKEIEGAPRVSFAQFPGEFHPLGFTPRKGCGRLPELDVAEPHIHQGFQLVSNVGHIFKEGVGLVYGHVENIGDVTSFVFDFQGVPVKAKSPAGFTGHVHVGKKMHLYLDDPVTVACLTSSPPHVEAETPGFVTPYSGIREHGKEFPYRRKHTRVGGRVGAGRSADWALVNVNHLVDMMGAS